MSKESSAFHLFGMVIALPLLWPQSVFAQATPLSREFYYGTITHYVSPSPALYQSVLVSYIDAYGVLELHGDPEFTLALRPTDADGAATASVNEPLFLESGTYFLELIVGAEAIPGSSSMSASASANVSASFLDRYVPWKQSSDGTFSAGSSWVGDTPPSGTSVTRHSALFAFGDAYTVTWDGNVTIEDALVTGSDVTFDLSANTASVSGERGLEVIGGGTEAMLTISNGRIRVAPNGGGKVSIGTAGGSSATLEVPQGSDIQGGVPDLRAHQLRAHTMDLGPSGVAKVADDVVVGNSSLLEDEEAVIITESITMDRVSIFEAGQLLLAGANLQHGVVEVRGRLEVFGLPGFDTANRVQNPLLVVGGAGMGTLRIMDGGTVGSDGVGLALFTDIGFDQGSKGLIEVVGGFSGIPSTFFTQSGELRVGHRGDGSDITGATSSTYTIDQAEAAHAGEYTVVATNSAGSATSEPATLSVLHFATPALHSWNFDGDYRLSFAVNGASGYDYVVQESTNLVDWTSMQTNSSPFTFTSTAKTNLAHRFFRVLYR